MAASIIGALRAVLGLDTAQFESGADRASSKAGTLKSALMAGAGALTELVAPAALATAGVAAFAKGMEMAQQALDFADELDATATKIGVTAESLQSLRFAAQDADIDAAAFDSSLQSLNATLGALQSGIGDAKIRKAFEALGIPQEQIDSMKDASDLLPVLADRIGKVGTQAEQVQIAKKLGVGDLLPLLQRGADGIRELQDEARGLGVVLANDVVTRMADMSREVELADQRAKTASVTLGSALTPALVTLKNATADTINWLVKLVDQLNKVDQRTTETLLQKRAQLQESIQESQSTAWLPGGKEYIARLQSKLDAVNSELMRRYKAAMAPREGGAAEGLPTVTGGSGGASSPRAKAAKKAGEDWADWFAQARQNRLDHLDRQANADRINAGELGDVIATEKNGLKITETITNAVEDGVGDGIEASRQTVYDSYRDTFAGAFDAGLRGGWKGIGQWFSWQLTRAMGDMFSTWAAGKATGGGWMGAIMSGVGKVLGAGANADGTTNWRGGLTWVGERGPELLNIPQGAGITSNHTLASALGSADSGLIVSVMPSDLFTVEVRRVSREEARTAGVQAAQGGAGLAQERQARAAAQRLA